MKYKKVKDLLTKNGFKLEALDSCSHIELDTLIFEKEHTKECIVVDFSSKSKIPKYIKDDGCFDYATAEWLEDFNVNSVSFQIDISLSFMSENVLDVYGTSDENVIVLHGKDLKYFEYVLNLVTIPYALMDFHKEYNKQLTKFFNGIKRFLPILEKHNIPHRINKISGNENCIFPSIDFEFYLGKFQYISFFFTPITWKKNIRINIVHDEDGDSIALPFNIGLVEFETCVQKQMDDYAEVIELYRKSKSI